MIRRKPRLLHLGATAAGEPLYIDYAARKTHMHVLGVSGKGKTCFLEYLIRQDIRNGDGLCLIDPHGTLYHNIVAWCAAHPAVVSWDKLILLDATAPGWAFGFNPLDFAGASLPFAVDAMASAVAQVWGGEDLHQTPTLKRVLWNVFYALAEQGLTLLEAEYLLSESAEHRLVREYLTRRVTDPMCRDQWASWNAAKPHDRTEEFRSCVNRLVDFFVYPQTRNIIGQQGGVVNFREVMERGGIVLVNLEERRQLSDDKARLLGTLLTHDLFLQAQSRPEGSRPFYFYIDECGRYLNESIQRMLDESRKRSLHLILANQNLAQLRAAGETVYKAVMGGAQTKVVFGGGEADDADTMVRQVFLDLNLEEPKKSLVRKAVAGQQLVVLEGGGTGRGTTTGRAHATASGYSVSTGVTQGETAQESWRVYEASAEETQVGRGLSLSSGVSTQEGYMTSEVDSTSEARSVSEMKHWTQAFQTLYEDAPGAVYSLEEQRYRKAAWLRKQPPQSALLVTPDYVLTAFRVHTLREPKVDARRVERFVRRRFEALPCVQPVAVVSQRIEERTLGIKQAAGLLPADSGAVDPYDNPDPPGAEIEPAAPARGAAQPRAPRRRGG